MSRNIPPQERKILLRIARKAIEEALKGEENEQLQLDDFSHILREPGACFVTLSRAGKLRGCVGSIEPEQALILDVHERAISAALKDPRFPPLTLPELEDLEIEISFLSRPQPLDYETSEELINKLQIGIDGVIMKKGYKRATFLPQVWKKLPDPELFLSRLSQKMGLPPDIWRHEKMDIEIYQVEDFSDQDIRRE
jgi:AmmeMemoRadiSam system protein A